MKRETYPQSCPICMAREGETCMNKAGNSLAFAHSARKDGEHGAWTKIYDAKYRDHHMERFGKTFNRQYTRVA